MSNFAVELCNISKIFTETTSYAGDIVAVHQVNLAIRAGEFFTLLGPSGCGKTTILRLIAGFETPTTGEICIQGQPMNNVPANRRPVNLVFQNYALFPHLNVADNVGFGLAVKRISKVEREPRIRKMLELVRLPDVSRRRPASLSGGQQQRVALARALVNEPAVLLLDEPLGALDLKLRKQMQLELKHIQQQVGITFIYVTHDQEEALTMSDRIAVMNEGNVLQVGTPIEVYEKPVNRFVADFIGESNFLEARVAKIEKNQVFLLIGSQEIIVDRQGVGLLSPGQQVTLTIRPEKVMLKQVTDGEPGLTGEVREVVYLGTDTRLSIRLSTGSQIVVRKQNVNGHDLGDFALGQTVQVAWAAHNAYILIN